MAFPLPTSLTPSKASAFTECPLTFRYVTIDNLPQIPTIAQVRGTFVHSVLEGFHGSDLRVERNRETMERCYYSALELLPLNSDFVTLDLNEEEIKSFEESSKLLLENYLEVEDPREVKPIGLEIKLEKVINGVLLRGIIDRLDMDDNGNLIVVDYKTGSSPSSSYEASKFNGMRFYALLILETLGVLPSEVKLIYLKDKVIVSSPISPQIVKAQQSRLNALWKAVERACENEDFRASPSYKCKWCSFQNICPQFQPCSKNDLSI